MYPLLRLQRSREVSFRKRGFDIVKPDRAGASCRSYVAPPADDRPMPESAINLNGVEPGHIQRRIAAFEIDLRDGMRDAFGRRVMSP